MNIKSVRTFITAGVFSTGMSIMAPCNQPKNIYPALRHTFAERLAQPKDGTIVANLNVDVFQPEIARLNNNMKKIAMSVSK